MSTPRHENWPQLLYQFLSERRNLPFQWGKTDCAVTASDWVKMVTVASVDPAEELRGKYSTALGAARILKARGGVDGIAQAAAEKFGWRAVPVSLAQRGDVVFKETDHGSALGVCDGFNSFFPGQRGLLPQRTINCAKSWRIA